MAVRTLTSPRARSLGDALREIDSHDIVRHDFILVTSDVVANCKLAELIERHR
jgi:translation initiation factor eIF-2B subunit epsilon